MIIVIPARYASTRLPGKALVDIGGKPMIEHVYARARASKADRVIVATDDERIADAVHAFGGEVCMTGSHHQSGTDRIAEVIAALAIGAQEIVVNLQGDEPLMPPDLINQVAYTLNSHPQAVMATASHAIRDRRALMDPNLVKVVTDCHGFALYFSRAPIPWARDAMAHGGDFEVNAHGHIGIYAYRAEFVCRYSARPPCPLERIEALEQLRVLWNGERIAVCQAKEAPMGGVDTPADLERVRAILGHGREV